MEDDDKEDPYACDSGPFCQHWDAPSDCTKLCICSHQCREHDGQTDECRNDNCKCKKFEDAPDN